MSNKAWALIAAILIPYFIFVIVIGLNESDFERTVNDERAKSFDIEKKRQLNKPKPKKKPKKKKLKQSDRLPSLKPSNLGNSLSGSDLSFGVPLFDENEFSEFQDDSLLGTGDDTAMDKSSVDTPPKVIKRSPIVYPELARKQGVSGYVSMNVLIDENGNVEDVEIVDSKPTELFNLKADSTIRRWKFEPATYNGKKVKVWAMQKIVFKLN